MITIHVDYLDRFNRAMPLLGIPFITFQAYQALALANREDEAYIKVMKDMGSEPKERLMRHSVKQEWFLINSVAITLLLTWLVSYIFFYGSIRVEYLFFGTTLIAMLLDFVAGKISLQVFSAREREGS